jgi:hypothetical protein
MPSNVAPQQVYARALDVKKGWPSQHALDFHAKLSSNVTAELAGGSCVHLNSSGEFEAGAKGKQVAMFLIQSPYDYDVQNLSPTTGGWTDVVVTGTGSALVSIGPYHLETTEFDTTVGVTFAPNDLLHSPTEDQTSTKSDAGKLFNRKGWGGGGNGALTIYTDHVCGQATGPVYRNAHGVNVLGFWTVHFPTASA